VFSRNTATLKSHRRTAIITQRVPFINSLITANVTVKAGFPQETGVEFVVAIQQRPCIIRLRGIDLSGDRGCDIILYFALPRSTQGFETLITYLSTE